MKTPAAAPIAAPAVRHEAAPIAAAELDAAAIKQGLTFLKRPALLGSDPALYVALVCDNPAQYEDFIRLVSLHDFEYFVALDADLAKQPFLGWFTAFYNGIRQAFSGADSVDADTTGGAGDVPNPKPNGRTGIGGAS